MGKNVFTQVSGALGPLRDALAQTLNRRVINVWKDNPAAHELLQRTLIKKLMEPAPQPLLNPATTLQEVARAFVDKTNEFFYISADGQTLDGIVTISDLIRARAAGAGASTAVGEFMTKNPVALVQDDDCAVAATAIREYRLKTVPIVERKDNRKLCGCLRFRRLMGYLFDQVGSEQQGASVAAETPRRG